MYQLRLAQIVLGMLLFSSFYVAAQDGSGYFLTYWEEKDHSFRNPDTSPLEPKDRAVFDSIPRYAFNPEYRVVVKWEPLSGEKPQQINTTTEAKRRMQKAGHLVFELKGKSISLPVYRDLTMARMKNTEPSYFLPFTDLTNGEETYGGGRYMDLDDPGLEPAELVLDFNLAYNPYCVYSPKYSCPVPPRENHMDLRIEAGARVK